MFKTFIVYRNVTGETPKESSYTWPSSRCKNIKYTSFGVKICAGVDWIKWLRIEFSGGLVLM